MLESQDHKTSSEYEEKREEEEKERQGIHFICSAVVIVAL